MSESQQPAHAPHRDYSQLHHHGLSTEELDWSQDVNAEYEDDDQDPNFIPIASDNDAFDILLENQANLEYNPQIDSKIVDSSIDLSFLDIETYTSTSKSSNKLESQGRSWIYSYFIATKLPDLYILKGG